MRIREKLELMKKIKAANEAHVKEWKNMADKMLKGVLINAKTNVPEIIDIPQSLDALTKVLECDYIETVPVMIEGKRFLVVLDEEGKMKSGQRISGACFADGRLVDLFVGNLFVISPVVTPEGDMTGLTDTEATYVINHGIRVLVTGEVILGCQI